jgi:hypothetical protein
VAAKKQQAENGSPIVVFTVSLIATSPRALIVRQRFCEHCSEDRLTQAATEVTRQLLEELAVRSGRTILAVKSTPSGARIVLDGVSIGATDGTFNTYPGLHTVILEKPGYLTQTVSVQATEGKTAEVSVALPESPATFPTKLPPPPTTSRFDGDSGRAALRRSAGQCQRQAASPARYRRGRGRWDRGRSDSWSRALPMATSSRPKRTDGEFATRWRNGRMGRGILMNKTFFCDAAGNLSERLLAKGKRCRAILKNGFHVLTPGCNLLRLGSEQISTRDRSSSAHDVQQSDG